MSTFAIGGCACGAVRFRLTAPPMITHCCHCTWCQRETGSAFAVNAMLEAGAVEVTQGAPELVDTPSESGKGQKIARCPDCAVALWSNYAGMGEKARFVRVGTLDDPDACPPDVHIFTRSKRSWVVLPPDAPAFEVFYEREKLWPPEALARRQALLDAPS